MNLILFEPDEIARALPKEDPRAQHILHVLRRAPGASFDAGLTSGVRGRAHFSAMSDAGLILTFEAGPPLPAAPETILIIGRPRPQTARDILRDATTLGATALHFVDTARTDPNYRSSTLWHSGEWRRHVVAGAMQGFDPRLPAVSWHQSLSDMIAGLDPSTTRIALDPYEAAAQLNGPLEGTGRIAVAIGPERGWAAADRDVLGRAGFRLVHLGPRVLRTETAVVAALALVNAGRTTHG